MPPAIVPIVEGQSEIEGVPVLLRRCFEQLGVCDLQVARPFRVPRTRVVREGEIERAVKLAEQDREGAAGIIVLQDADNACPRDLGSSLLARCKTATQLPVRVVIANRELEGWFLGAKESLRGVRGIRDTAEAPPDPERIGGAKERLSDNMEGKRYLEVDDQPALAAKMDLELARTRCPSFDKFLRDVRSLVAEIRS